jgi:O-antigen/teichoic acid export membrane protein
VSTQDKAIQEPSLKTTTINASMWSMGGFAFGNFLRLISNVVLAYLLTDNIAALGLMALVTTFLQGLRMFSDMGLNLGVIQHKDGASASFVRTAWTLQAIRGVVLYGACWVLAVPFATAYGEPELATLILWTGVITIFNGLASSGLILAKRNLDVKKLTFIEVGSQIAGLIVVMVWAFQSASVWALVAGNITGAIVRTVASHIVFAERSVWFGWDKAAASALLRFGGWIFVATVLTFASSQIDKLAFGKVFNTWSLGIFGVAATFAMVPMQAVMRLGNQVVFPVYAKVVNRGDDLSTVLDRVRNPVLVTTGLAASGMFAGGPWLIKAIYPPEFVAAGWMLQLLSVGLLLRVMSETSKAALLAIGQPKAVVIGQAMKLVCFAIFAPLGYIYLGKLGVGMMGFVAAISLSECGRYASMLILAMRKDLHVLPRDAATCWMTVVASMAGMFAGDAIAGAMAPGRMQAAASLAVASGVVGLFWLRPMLASVRELKSSR